MLLLLLLLHVVAVDAAVVSVSGNLCMISRTGDVMMMARSRIVYVVWTPRLSRCAIGVFCGGGVMVVRGGVRRREIGRGRSRGIVSLMQLLAGRMCLITRHRIFLLLYLKAHMHMTSRVEGVVSCATHSHLGGRRLRTSLPSCRSCATSGAWKL